MDADDYSIIHTASPTNVSSDEATFIHRPSTLSLPVEIWERVLDWLVTIYTPVHRNATESTLSRDLFNCALVCRAWRARAQTHLFAYPSIRAPDLSVFEATIRKIPVLCEHVQELLFENEPIVAQNGVTKTVDTISHVTRVAHKFPKAHYFLFRDNDLSVEHPYLSRSLAACRFINWLDYFTSIPTRLPHLVRFIAAFNKLSIVSLAVPIILDQETSIPNISNVLRSSPEVLILWLEPGNHLLLDWLIESKTFVKSLRQLVVTLDNRVPSQEISLHAERLQSLLDLCCKHIKVWDFYRYEDLKPMPLGTVLPVVINNFTLTYLLLYSLPPDANVSRKTKI